jgi:formylglycine-generating enzyme required for sulfatase activity
MSSPICVRLVLLIGLLLLPALVLPAWTRAPAPSPNKPPRETTSSIGMKLLLVPRGKFLMGSPKEEKERDEDEGPQRQVAITRAFYLGQSEVTQKQFREVMGYNPSFFATAGQGRPGVDYGTVKPGGGADRVRGHDTDDFPVENVSWQEAVEFCKKLSARPAEKRSARVYRLPTEAEWEYACRGGAPLYQTFHLGNALSSGQVNCDGSVPYGGAPRGPYLQRTSKVGAYKRPNGFGLCDMHGNVWEWCSDWYARDYYAKGLKADPPGPDRGSERVMRGGGWYNSAAGCRSAARRGGRPGHRDHDLGFRVVLVEPVR